MAKKRFPDWNPEIGEIALVPGGPACAHYVSELDADDVRAINSGHRGYIPLLVEVVDDNLKGTQYEGKIETVLEWDDRKKHWSCDGGHFKTLDAALRAIKRSIPDSSRVHYAVDNDRNMAYNNPSRSAQQVAQRDLLPGG